MRVTVLKRGSNIHFTSDGLDSGPYKAEQVKIEGLRACIHAAEILGVEPKECLLALIRYRNSAK